MSSAAPPPRKLFVTTALPYANGPFHIGHIMEYIQADIWVRFQRMQGHEVHFVCADDAHGAPIMLKAEEEGITPEQLIARVGKSHVEDWQRYAISFDTTHSTHSPENVELAQSIYRKLRDHKPSLIGTQDDRAVLRSGQGHVPRRPLHQGHLPEVRHEGPVRGRRVREVRHDQCADRPRRSVFRDHRRQAGAARVRAPVLSPVRSAGRSTFLERWTQGDAAAARGVQQDPGVAGRRRQGAQRLGHLARRALLRHRGARTRPASTSTSGSTRRSATWPR